MELWKDERGVAVPLKTVGAHALRLLMSDGKAVEFFHSNYWGKVWENDAMNADGGI